ncbi:radical SAM protein [bacterium]|nr:MAG: radical SAM protein [bacterium]
MKILLIRNHDYGDINTRLPESLNKIRGVLPPLGLAYIAAVLEQAGYKVVIIDVPALNLTTQDLRRRIIEESPDIVGATTMTSTLKGALEVLKIAKESSAITVIGGPQLAIYPQETLSYDFIDYGIIGEGEYPFLNLVRAIEEKKPVKEIQGLVYKENSKVYANPAYIHMNLDEIPFPSRHLLPMKRYTSIISQDPMTTMISSRGCPFQCGFCFKTPSDAKYRSRSAKNIVDEMELLSKEYKLNEIMFYDDTLTYKKEHVTAICDEILKRNLKIRWESPTRVDNIDIELLKLMRKAGCVRLRYGVESGDREILKLMRKGIDLDLVKQVFRLTKKSGIETFAYFIIGYIHENIDTLKNTISLAKTLNPDYVMFTVATPYPGTPLYAMARDEGYISGDYWRDYTLGLRDERLPYFVPDAQTWISKAYRDFYFQPAYITKRLLRLTNLSELRKDFLALKGLICFKMQKTQ